MIRKSTFVPVALLAAFVLPVTAACSSPAPRPEPVAFVHLFEWKWPDVARECEAFLGPNGYTAVQISPPQEHVPGPQWWTRYQPVSYRLESRGGSREEFDDMVQRCEAAGVEVYADAIINHMSGVGEGVGVAGSAYGPWEYPAVPYSYDDFHHCGRYGDDDIRNYQDAWEVRNCELANLADLDHSRDSVQRHVTAYLDDLVSTGVAGFRIDAAKHMTPGAIADILARMKAQPFVFQEVIDRGNEPIKGDEYTGNGLVTEFKFGMALFDAFSAKDLSALGQLGSGEGFLAADQAVVFVDNHDIQRGHGGGTDVLSHQHWAPYELANVFMLAWPYGYPMVMSSYRFENGDQGPPDTRPIDENDRCSAEWVCEHRDPAISAMVGFRRETTGEAVTHWRQLSPSAIAFGRGSRGFVAINAGTEPVSLQVQTGLAKGLYRNLLHGGDDAAELVVAEDGSARLNIPPMSSAAWLARSEQ